MTQLQAPLVFIGTEMDGRQIEMDPVWLCTVPAGLVGCYYSTTPSIVLLNQMSKWVYLRHDRRHCNPKKKYLLPNLLISQRSLNMLHRVALMNDENTNMAKDSASCCAAGLLLVSTLNVIGGQRCRFPCPL